MKRTPLWEQQPSWSRSCALGPATKFKLTRTLGCTLYSVCFVWLAWLPDNGAAAFCVLHISSMLLGLQRGQTDRLSRPVTLLSASLGVPMEPCACAFFFINLAVYVIFWSKDWVICLLACSFCGQVILFSSPKCEKQAASPAPWKPLLNSLLSNQREKELPQHLEIVWVGIPFCLFKDMEESLNQDWKEASFSSVTED